MEQRPLPQRTAEGRQSEASRVSSAGETLPMTHPSVIQGVSCLSSSKHLELGGGWVTEKEREHQWKEQSWVPLGFPVGGTGRTKINKALPLP